MSIEKIQQVTIDVQQLKIENLKKTKGEDWLHVDFDDLLLDIDDDEVITGHLPKLLSI